VSIIVDAVLHEDLRSTSDDGAHAPAHGLGRPHRGAFR
jgi:hypothetical protein